MSQVNKIDSNSTDLRIAEEATLGVLPGTPVWKPYEPNSYSDFGGKVTTIARNPINSSRQRKKGVITDLDANGGFNNDLTQTNIQDILQGFFFADFRRKGEEVPTQATATTDLFDVAETAGFLINSLFFVSGFVNSANNGLHLASAIVVDTTVEALASTLITETPPATANMVVVGQRGASADIDVDASGDFATYVSAVLDFTTLGLIPGEWIFVGGDLAVNQFVNAANNGWKRVKSISANALVVDKSELAMITETGTALLIDMYFGRVLKNELGAAIVRRTYQMERTLGVPDDALPAEIQAEYVIGSVPSELTVNIGQADKITVDLGFVATDNEQVTGAVGVKSGTRPALEETDAFNTSSDFSRIKLATVSNTDEAPAPLFAFASEVSLTLNNNVSPNKAISVLGAFNVTAGTFEIGGSITAYFGNVSAIAAVRNNSDITLDMCMAKANKGIAIDVPLITLGDALLDVAQDEPIKIPLDMAASTGAAVDPNMDHTLLMVFFDYLPSLAE